MISINKGEANISKEEANISKEKTSISKEKTSISREKTSINKEEISINKEEINTPQETIIIKRPIHHIIMRIIMLKYHKEADREIIQKNIKDLVKAIEKNHPDKDQIEIIIIDQLQKVI